MTTGENQMNRWVMQRLRTLSVIPLTFLLASWAAAQERSIDLPDLSPPPASQGFAPAPGLTLDKATAIARRSVGGRVLSATPDQRLSGRVYHVRMLVEGTRVVTVTVDERGQVKQRK
ncbi:MAG: PepSY domain-containing protein [Pseudomonadales bacterium]|mgnify:FL=1|jgi:hypothetical protein|nr:PepSY domain-containing protein [Pseudomonadales bacterium]